MKKSLLAVAVAAALPGVALAQTNVTMYGIVDAGVSWVDNGDATAMRVDPGVQSANRFGVRGVEDLGGGVRALFTLEAGFALDTAVQTQQPSTGTRLFSRQAFVGLGSGLGTLTIGRQYSPGFWVLANMDPFGLGFWGNTGGYLGAAPGGPIDTVRIDNSVQYQLPNLSGFTGRLMWSPGRNNNGETLVAGSNNGVTGGAPYSTNKAGRFLGGNLEGTFGAFGVSGAYHQYANNINPDSDNAEWLIAGKAGFGSATVFAGYANIEIKNPGVTPKNESYWLGLTYKMGAATLGAKYAHTKLSNVSVNASGAATAAAGTNGKGDTWALFATYDLSKRTNLYANWAMVTNDGNGVVPLGTASGALGVVTPGKDPMAVSIGVRHQF